MRNRFDRQLVQLNDEMIEMGSMIEKAIQQAITALIKQDTDAARKIIEYDEDIDQQEKIIENLCLKLLLQQQPVAKDLRQISAALKMITDMERIGDQAADIAEIITFLNGRSGEECACIDEMARATIRMVTGSVDAYVRQDTALAERVIAHDDVVDNYFDRVKHALINLIAKKPENRPIQFH